MHKLPEPAKYFPFLNGKYDVSPGLRPFGSDFGNGPADQAVFQIDREFTKYRNAKVAARQENLPKYFQPTSALSGQNEARVAKFIIDRLIIEYPNYFLLSKEPKGSILECKLTCEKLAFDNDLNFSAAASTMQSNPPYRSAFDALAAQLQEDLAIWSWDEENNREWLSAIHLCYPNHWAAAEKIGKDFRFVHIPVAGFERVAQTSDALVKAMVTRGPFVRFAWGVATDNRLNHHPEPPPGIPGSEWLGREFNPKQPNLFVRFERQTLHGFPDLGISLFTIRTYFHDAKMLRKDNGERQALCDAIESMSPEQLVYKGLSSSKENIMNWLRSL